MSDEKLTNERKAWSQADDDLLLLLVQRHTPKSAMVPVLQRTERSIVDRLHRHHKAVWNASGHPESAPTSSGTDDALERLEKTLENVDRTLTGICRSLGRPGEVMERLTILEAKLDALQQPKQQVLTVHHGPANGRDQAATAEGHGTRPRAT